ncbi:DUF4097 family beta strand repeat-containing protein [Paucilactobacillus suebicus]|uniref:DUF4097 domain-containing protein n=1 Tax=Paucilactobacillus suebicus DSM 5007 = KCTC 3549 TaxID=1423807 RepID=A0A0R1VYZ1_9LACO|nr:DUF4097 family beta strand repeat-containing protein [Paucilactobacillus suebicus]KRM10865.1 hypothetical protein FD16_GL001061 [Paucilactobacillus suebicus DSM 5007 = KCTC 3549]
MVKKSLIVGLIITIIGAVIAVIGFSMGASMNITWNHGFKVVHPYHNTQKLSKIKNIQLDVNDSNVYFKNGDHYQVSFDGYSVNKPSIEQSNGTLRISQHESDFSGISLSSMSNSKIVITVPEKNQLSSVNGEIEAADLITKDHLNVNNIDLQLDNGSVTSHGLTVNKGGQLSVQDGSINFNSANLTNINVNQSNGSQDTTGSTLNGGKFTNENGSQTFTNVTFNQSVTVNNQNGHVKLTSPNTQGYQLSTQNGSIDLFNTHYSTSANQNDSAANKVIISNENGSITVN